MLASSSLAVCLFSIFIACGIAQMPLMDDTGRTVLVGAEMKVEFMEDTSKNEFDVYVEGAVPKYEFEVGDNGASYHASSSQPISANETYLEPYLDELIDYTADPIAKEYIMAANIADVLPAWLIDHLVPFILPNSSLTVPIADHSWFHPFDQPIRVTVPVGRLDVPAPATLVVESIEVDDLNQFKSLKPLKLLKSSKFTWAGSITSEKLAARVSLKLTMFGLGYDVTVNLSLTKPSIDYEAIIALNRTRTCEVWGEVMQSSAMCAIWPLSHHESAGVSGFNLTALQITMTDFTFEVESEGLLPSYAAKFLNWYLKKNKESIISNMPGTISANMQKMANKMALHKIPSLHKHYPCSSPIVSGASTALNASKICISNNGAYLMNWKAYNCPAHSGSQLTRTYPIDQSQCMDMKTVFPDAVEGQVLRSRAFAVWGMHTLLDPPLRYVPDSNAAGFKCSGTVISMKCDFVSLAPINPNVLPQVERVCFMNHAFFVMSYEVQSIESKNQLAKSSKYPINMMKCTNLSSIDSIHEGDVLQMKVHAVLGRNKMVDRTVQYKQNGGVATFDCKGVTWSYSCKLMVNEAMWNKIVVV